MSMGRLKDGVCVCVYVCVCVLPLIGFVIATDYLWLKYRLMCNSVLQLGFECVGGHIKFVLLNEH
jgi:hypothetical protein